MLYSCILSAPFSSDYKRFRKIARTKISPTPTKIPPARLNCKTTNGKTSMNMMNPATASHSVSLANSLSILLTPEATRIIPIVEKMNNMLDNAVIVISMSAFEILSFDSTNNTIAANVMPPKNPVTFCAWPWNGLPFATINTKYYIILHYFCLQNSIYVIKCTLIHGITFVCAIFTSHENNPMTRRTTLCNYCNSKRITINHVQRSKKVFTLRALFSPRISKTIVEESSCINCAHCGRIYKILKVSDLQKFAHSFFPSRAALREFRNIFPRNVNFEQSMVRATSFVQIDNDTYHIIFIIRKIRAFWDCTMIRGCLVAIGVERIY